MRIKKLRKAGQVVHRVIEKIPLVDVLPLTYRAWRNMPDEQKEEVLQNLLIAGSRAAARGYV